MTVCKELLLSSSKQVVQQYKEFTTFWNFRKFTTFSKFTTFAPPPPTDLRLAGRITNIMKVVNLSNSHAAKMVDWNFFTKNPK